MRPEVLAFIIVLAIVIWLAWNVYGQKLLNKAKKLDISSALVTNTHIMLPEFGRLGNQLFQAAAVIGIAESNKCAFALPANIRDGDLGKLMELEGVQLGHSSPSLTIKEVKENVYSAVDLPKDGRIYNLKGFYQSHLYFERSRATVCKVFQPHKHLVARVVAKMPQCVSKDSIGIHVRRGDYLSKDYAGQYSACTPTYYQTSIELIREQVGDVPVIVCSDDIKWCKENLKLDNIHFSDTGSALEDFIVLLQCQHLVMGNSTFSWWAAYLKPTSCELGVCNPNHIIIAPHPWYGLTGSKAHLNIDELYCPDWNIMEADGSSMYTPKRVQTLVDIASVRLKMEKGVNPKGDKRKLYGDIYIVSLDNARERLASAFKTLKKAGLQARRFPAIDRNFILSLGGRRGLKDAELIKEPDKQLDNDAAIGCGLSHMAIWALALFQGKDRVTVFEDDITSYISEGNLDRRIEEAMRYMDTDWDFLYMGKCLDKCELYVKVVDGLYRTKRPHCTHAYIVSTRAIRKFLARPLYTSIDIQIVHGIETGVFKAYALHPSVFIQNIVKWSSTMRSYDTQIPNQNDCEYIE